MADSNTTLFGLTLPEVGASADTWGAKLNSGLTFLDVLFAQINPVQHRLSLTTAVPVTVSDVTAATTLYMTPDKGNGIVSFDGTYWDVVAQAELSMALSSDSGHAGYHQSGKLFDVFYFDDAGTKRIGTGPAWTNDTTRSSGITRLNGVYVNTSSMTVRFGSASGNTVTLAANRGTYLGTIYCTANGQTEDSAAKRMVWNAYNRRHRYMQVLPTVDTYTYTTDTIRQMNKDVANRIAFVRGLDEDAVSARGLQFFSNSSAGVYAVSGIGRDSTTTMSGKKAVAYMTAPSSISPLPSEYNGLPGLGYHYLSLNEYSQAGGTATWYGDWGVPAIVQAGLTGEVFA